MTSESEQRISSLTSWYAPWQGLRVCVLGLGVTGFAAADVLAELGAKVQVIAAAADDDRQKILDVLGVSSLVAKESAQLRALQDFDPELIIVSPGYRPDNPLLLWAAEQHIPVWGDIELAWRVRDKVNAAVWVCITGTNGKTTTAQLTAHMLAAGGLRVAPVGNIGVPVLDAVRDPAGFDVLVVELSSFQLHWLQHIEPHVSCVLNLADDHLDWHGDFKAYAAAKAKIYENTKVACIYNRAVPETEQMVAEADVQEGARAVSFGLDTPPVAGFGVVEEILVDRGYHEDRWGSALELVTLEQLRHAGLAQPHTVANILAAAALARGCGVAPEQIAQAILSFVPDPHRMQQVLISGGVSWINDSKATNAHAANASLQAVSNVVWIVGGDFKGADPLPLVRKHADRLRAAVVIGRERGQIMAALNECLPELPLVEILDTPGLLGADAGAQVMRDAVTAAMKLATAGDTVLLAPAAASIDQFSGYAQRGDAFMAAVHELNGAGDE